ncbi:hypothetical protein OAO87_03245 [bacterium]|nr:hypothetical protein [bacterium]
MPTQVTAALARAAEAEEAQAAMESATRARWESLREMQERTALLEQQASSHHHIAWQDTTRHDTTRAHDMSMNFNIRHGTTSHS